MEKMAISITVFRLIQTETTTGYYLRKYLDESIADISTTYSAQPWIEIRLAEVYLNLAEAAAMLGSTYDKDANNAIRTIRERVKLPYTDLTGGRINESHQTRKKSRISLRGLLLLGFKKMENGR